ncbi:MAG: class I SAM-dependent methyltransferase [Gammaproteobacteria bacterium]|nr:class I SAM-dependent methyltransferase [Gammaproteobacteria bacterium]
MPKIAVFSETTDLKQQADALAQHLSLPVAENPDDYDYLLILTDQALALKKNGVKTLPLVIDFLSGPMTYRRQHASLKRETLARALGLKGHSTDKIVDATAGLGRDSFILASLGFHVQLLERSPIIQVLLEDAINRALPDPQVGPIVSRMHLCKMDSIHWMQQQTIDMRPQIIYLDPMFPERSKSALVKKEMLMFHEVIGDDPDAGELLSVALTCATKRVVVKRSRLSAPLLGRIPSFTMEGSSSRFDIYLI